MKITRAAVVSLVGLILILPLSVCSFNATPEELKKREPELRAEAKETRALPGWKKEVRHVKVGMPKGEEEREITYYTNTIGMQFVLIPPGEFMMGSPDTEPGRKQDEGPQHRVRITKPFYMGAHEVTNAQYQLFEPNHSSSQDIMALPLSGDEQPVVYVSWDDAKAFCEWLSRKEGVQYGLPTEAEWEYACRAGSSGPYWWGEKSRIAGQDADVAKSTSEKKWPDWASVMTDDGKPVTAPVGSFLPNAFGLHDMLGNLWEWCEDWYDRDYYARSPEIDPGNRTVGRYHVLRGGSISYFPRYARSATRIKLGPTVRDFYFGFRVAVRFGAQE